MPRDGVFDQAGEAYAEEGQVMLDGPDGVAVSLTPGAAEQTARALLRAASDARRQLDGRELES
ncbi:MULTISPECIES: hypothetical protein [Sphingobium]|uniref:Uncharacterized protein n=1 Tax=Sphingobium chungbukense TaxID=56193 RepID=A0A0M3AMV3_9SPHN|nr:MULTISPECIES: hypothetical protein [Sphingobium]KKW91492.1 hypothetical protein YP76_13880 [Sphingobium chungbukense]PJG46351.1 hypothetical protein CAF53_19390 [Sphingobium sp. LB126]